MTKMTDFRRHMVPAFFACICENFERVFVHAAVKCPGVIVPPGTSTRVGTCPIMVDNVNSSDSQVSVVDIVIVTLDFGLKATNSFYQNEKGFGAKMRFNGVARDVFLPFESIVGISSPDAPNIAMDFPLYYGQEVLAVNDDSDRKKKIVNNNLCKEIIEPESPSESSRSKQHPRLKLVKNILH